MIDRNMIALALASQQMQPQLTPPRQQPRSPIPRPFLPPQMPVRSMPPTMIGTPQAVQHEAATDTFQQALRAADPIERYEPGKNAFAEALKKYFSPTDMSGGAAP
jgi:hypothetical protein